MKDVIGFGALNMDLIYEVDTQKLSGYLQIPFEAGREVTVPETLFDRHLALLEGCSALKRKSGGGSAANTVFALSRFGFLTGFVGKVGRDSLGDELIRALGKVDSSGVVRGRRSGTCLILLDSTRDRFIILYPNSNNELVKEDLDLDYLRNTRYLHLSSFSGDLPMEAQKSAVDQIHNKVKISIDPGELYAQKGWEVMRSLVEKCYILFATDTEIEILTGSEHREGCKKILEIGPSIVVCKRGLNGSYIMTREALWEIPAKKVEGGVDTTGAGDVYNAGFLAGMLIGIPLERCALLATDAAAQSIMGYGRAHYPDKELLRSFLREGAESLKIEKCRM